MIKVLLVSGPPGSGKDEVAKTALELGYDFHVEKFATPLRQAAIALLGLDDDDDLEYAKRNDNGDTRRLLITLSEELCKPLFGKEHFGNLCGHRILEWGADLVLITDAGFPEECEAFLDRLGMTGEELYVELWKIQRPFHDFKGDSRNWISLKHRKEVVEKTIFNSTTLDQFKAQIEANLGAFDKV